MLILTAQKCANHHHALFFFFLRNKQNHGGWHKLFHPLFCILISSHKYVKDISYFSLSPNIFINQTVRLFLFLIPYFFSLSVLPLIPFYPSFPTFFSLHCIQCVSISPFFICCVFALSFAVHCSLGDWGDKPFTTLFHYLQWPEGDHLLTTRRLQTREQTVSTVPVTQKHDMNMMYFKSMFFLIDCGIKGYAKKKKVNCVDQIWMIPVAHIFLQSKLFIAVLHMVTIHLLCMCASSQLKPDRKDLVWY